MTDAEIAAGYIGKLRKTKYRDVGVEAALIAIGEDTGVGRWPIWGIYHDRRKTAGHGLIQRLRAVYLAWCQRELDRLALEILYEQARDGGDDLSDLASKVASLAEEVRQARSLNGGARG